MPYRNFMGDEQAAGEQRSKQRGISCVTRWITASCIHILSNTTRCWTVVLIINNFITARQQKDKKHGNKKRAKGRIEYRVKIKGAVFGLTG